MKFKYEAVNAKGEEVSGFFEAEDRDKGLNVLRGSGLAPTSVEEAAAAGEESPEPVATVVAAGPVVESVATAAEVNAVAWSPVLPPLPVVEEGDVALFLRMVEALVRLGARPIAAGNAVLAWLPVLRGERVLEAEDWRAEAEELFAAVIEDPVWPAECTYYRVSVAALMERAAAMHLLTDYRHGPSTRSASTRFGMRLRDFDGTRLMTSKGEWSVRRLCGTRQGEWAVRKMGKA